MTMKEIRDKVLTSLKVSGLSKRELGELLERPKEKSVGDYALPCFSLAKKLKRTPAEIAKDIAGKVKTSMVIERVEAVGGFVNIFVDKKMLAKLVFKKVVKGKDKYGSNSSGKGKKIVIEMSSPNIAKPFGIGHLRSTIIGNSIANIADFNGHKAVRINYLGDWGTQFGKIIFGFKKWGSEVKLKKDPIAHLLEIYVKANKKEYEAQGREWFKKLEEGNKEALKYWKHFKDLSWKDFEKIYRKLGIEFDDIYGESDYNKKLEEVLQMLKKKKLLEESDGALVVNLEKYGLGVSLIQKSDGTTLYSTRDIAAAIDRAKKYKFDSMFYEVGGEQKLHFKQFFKILELLGYKWAEKCKHIDHGLYLADDGKRMATRKGKTIFMEDILDETISLAKKEIEKRKQISKKELEERSRKIAIAAIFYGDLKNYRSNDMIFDINHFLSFEGDTGPYLLYSYARAHSIIRKARGKREKTDVRKLEESESALVSEIARFEEVVEKSFRSLAPNVIANYTYSLAKTFSDFYRDCAVLGSESESFRLELVRAFGQTIKNALGLLGIETIEEM